MIDYRAHSSESSRSRRTHPGGTTAISPQVLAKIAESALYNIPGFTPFLDKSLSHASSSCMSSSQQNHNVEVQVVVLDSYDQRTLRLYGFLESQQSPPAFSSANLREKLTEILEPTAGVKILDVKIIPLPDNS